MTGKIVNVRWRSPADASAIFGRRFTYCGRRCGRWPASPLGNPFKGGGSIDRYADWLKEQVRGQVPEVLHALGNIKPDSVLGCWCYPNPCHCEAIWETWELLNAKCLSVRQPFAWAISAGHKTVENRSWATSFRGKLLIHASQSAAYLDHESRDDWRRNFGVVFPPDRELYFGRIVAVADLAGCCAWQRQPGDRASDPWAFGPYLWVLRNVRALDNPFPCRGGRGLWKPPADLLPVLID